MSIHIIRLMNRYFDRQYQQMIYPIISRYYVRLAFLYLKKTNRSLPKTWQMVKMSGKYDVKTFLKYVLIEFYGVLKRHLL